MRKLVCAVIVMLTPPAAWSQTMAVSEFLARAEALKAKGAFALFSSDIKRLKTEIANSGAALRANEAAARKAGDRTDTCMPEKAAVTSDEVMAHFNAIPVEQRGVSVQQAFTTLVKRKYPCPS